MARGGRLFPLGPVSSSEYSFFGTDHEIAIIGVGIGHTNVNRFRLDQTSLFVKWTVLVSSGALCVLRPILMQMEIMSAKVIGCVRILVLIGFFSVLSEFFSSANPTGRVIGPGP